MAGAWNEFVAQSKQGTFLLDRNYMDYHSDRFTDFSLIVLRKDNIYALLPANITGDTLWSHQGLTYGGLITDTKATAADVCETFRAINDYLRSEHISSVVYKAVPWIYHRLPADEDLYALTNVCNASICARDISSTIDTSNRLRFTELRRRGVKKALRQGVTVGESSDMAAFWSILDNNLTDRFGVHPVHTLQEIQLLRSRFPDNIRLFMACAKDGTPLGVTLIFETPQVIHTQYISASPEGKACGALDMLFDYVINDVYADRAKYPHAKYFDFGKSTVDHGHELNHGLIFQKEGFGGRGVCYDWYTYNL